MIAETDSRVHAASSAVQTDRQRGQPPHTLLPVVVTMVTSQGATCIRPGSVMCSELGWLERERRAERKWVREPGGQSKQLSSKPQPFYSGSTSARLAASILFVTHALTHYSITFALLTCQGW